MSFLAQQTTYVNTDVVSYRKQRSLLFLLLLITLAYGIVFLFNSRFSFCQPFNQLLFRNGFFYSTLWAACLIFVSHCRSTRELYRAGSLALLLLPAALIAHTNDINVISAQIILCLWLGSSIILILEIINNTPIQKDAVLTLVSCLLLPVITISSMWFLNLTVWFDHKTDDWLLYAAEASFGFPFSFLANYLPHTHFIQLFFKGVYEALPAAWAIVYCLQNYKNKIPNLQLISEFILLGLFGMLLYHIIPAYGPRYAFHGLWPFHLPSVPQIPQSVWYTGIFPRNAMPSLHVAWAFCLWRQTRMFNFTIRALATLWLILIIASTFILGEHYIVDLIAGFTLAVAVRGLCATKLNLTTPIRLYCILSGILFCILWYSLVLWGLHFLRFSLIIPWLLTCITLMVVGKAEHDLAKAQQFVFIKT